jgi:hypothetical protein
LGEQRLHRLEKALLVPFDRQQVLPALFIKNLLRGLHLSMRRIGQHDFIDDVQQNEGEIDNTWDLTFTTNGLRGFVR